MYQFKFADIGEGLHEGKVTNILVKVGDSIKNGDPLFEVETDKVTSEITSPVDGKVAKINIQVDQTIHVGEVVFIIDDGSGGELPPDDAPAHKEAAPASEQPSAPANSPAPVEAAPSTNTTAEQPEIQVAISPLARKIALSTNVDLSTIQGSGPNGRIMVADLTAPLTTPTTEVITPTIVTRGVSGQRVKTTSLRQAIAKNLKNSWDNVAYVSEVVEVDVTSLVKLRSQYKDLVLKTTGIKLTYLPFIAKATSIALAQYPVFTATYDPKTQELVYPGTLNLGIAVDTDYGLVVPNIKSAETKTVLQLAEEIGVLATKARAKKLTGQDSANGHFTITNYGSAGAIFGMPVIKFPEIAILGTGAMVNRAGPNKTTKTIMYLTVAADHRWVDGVEIANFLTKIKLYLENPALLGVF